MFQFQIIKQVVKPIDSEWLAVPRTRGIESDLTGNGSDARV